MGTPLLKIYSTGCARNSRTVPYTMPNSPVVSVVFPGIMDWEFQEVIHMTDEHAMSIDFAILDDTWAYYAIANEKVSETSWRLTFTLCGLKTYMMKGNTTIKGKWNRTPTWIDSDTITPAVSGYKRGREIDLPGLLPEGWVYVEISIRMISGITQKNNESFHLGERNITLGTFAQENEDRETDRISVKDIVYGLSDYRYSVDGGINFDYPIDVEQIENISYNRICPYNFELINGKPELIGINKNFHIQRVSDADGKLDVRTELIEYINKEPDAPGSTTLEYYGVSASIGSAKLSMYFNNPMAYASNSLDRVLFTNESKTVFFFFIKGEGTEKLLTHPGGLGGGDPPTYVTVPKYSVIKYISDPRKFTPIKDATKKLYHYNNLDSTFNISSNATPVILVPRSGTITLGLTQNEEKFGVVTVFAPMVMGVIERSQKTVEYKYEVDNTGWYLNLYLPMNKIVIPSMKLPYVSDAWRAYQMREMEYDRAELNRSNQYATDKFWADIAKGMANGALAGGFAGTHSGVFGVAMGGTQFIGTAIGATIDRKVEVANNERAYSNTVDRMKTATDSYYNSGYGYRMINSNDFHINIAIPIDDMTEEVKMSGYSCTGNLTAILERGYIQGNPEPNDSIKGTIRNLIVNELQSGVWII